MATSFPTALDNFTNPDSNDFMNQAGVQGDVVVSNLNDAVEALEAKVGIDNSADPTSLDYQVDSLAQMGIVAESIPEVAPQTGVTDGVDIAGTEVTFTAVAGRQYVYQVENMSASTNVQGDKWEIQVQLDGSQIGVCGSVSASSADQAFVAGSPVRFDDAGSITLKAQANQTNGSGTLDVFGSAASPVRAYIVDIGPTI